MTPGICPSFRVSFHWRFARRLRAQQPRNRGSRRFRGALTPNPGAEQRSLLPNHAAILHCPTLARAIPTHQERCVAVSLQIEAGHQVLGRWHAHCSIGSVAAEAQQR